MLYIYGKQGLAGTLALDGEVWRSTLPGDERGSTAILGDGSEPAMVRSARLHLRFAGNHAPTPTDVYEAMNGSSNGYWVVRDRPLTDTEHEELFRLHR